jgi:hypothetical protein
MGKREGAGKKESLKPGPQQAKSTLTQPPTGQNEKGRSPRRRNPRPGVLAHYIRREGSRGRYTLSSCPYTWPGGVMGRREGAREIVMLRSLGTPPVLSEEEGRLYADNDATSA